MKRKPNVGTRRCKKAEGGSKATPRNFQNSLHRSDTQERFPIFINVIVSFFTGYEKTLDQFTYSDTIMHQTIFECLGDTVMVGVTGKISFINGEDPDRTVVMERVEGTH